MNIIKNILLVLMIFLIFVDNSLYVKADDNKSLYNNGKIEVESLGQDKYKIKFTNTYKTTIDNKLIINEWFYKDGFYYNKNNTFQAKVNTLSVNVTTKTSNIYYEPTLALSIGNIYPQDIYLKSSRELIIDYGLIKHSLWLSGGVLMGTWDIPKEINDIVTIKYNQVGNVNLKLGNYATDNDTEIIDTTKDTYENGSIIADTLYFNPDGNPEGSSVDGYIQRYAGGGTWASLHDSVNGDFIYPSATDGEIVKLSCYYLANQWNVTTRSFFLFDTSSLGDDVYITSATLSIRGQNKAEGSSPLFDIITYVIETYPASDTNLVAGDFDNYYDTHLCDSGINYDDWNTSGYNVYTLNQDGLDIINLNGVTKLGVMHQYDIDYSTPTWGSGSDYQALYAYYAEKGDGYEPILTLEVEVSPEPPYNISDNRTGIDQITLGWTDNGTVSGTSVNISVADSGTWYNVYNGLDETCNITGLNLDILDYDLKLWSYNPAGNSSIVDYSIEYATYNGTSGGSETPMEIIHLLSLIPLLALLTMSMIWYGRGLIHITLFAYSMTLAFVAINGSWELMFFPILAGTAIISLILFIYAMTKGDWL